MQKSIHFFIASGIALCCLATTSPGQAQIVPDATLRQNSSVTTQDNISTITGGTAEGGNLFHSFEQFSVPTGGEVRFNNAPVIQNIITRVTGESISNIDGLLRANGTANVFLLNPNGFSFGRNARLEIRGSFLASTASSLNFADGTQFSATDPQTTPLLTVSVPIGLQFGQTAGSILNQSQVTDNNRDNRIGLQVRQDKTLALVGGDVTLVGGNLRAAGGRIELGSVAGTGVVSLNPTDKGWVLGYSGVQNFQDIQLSGGASVSASGEGGGDIQVQGRRVTLTDGSEIVADTQESEPGGTLSVTASESVELMGISADGRRGSELHADVARGATGTGGNVTVETGRLILRDGARVSTRIQQGGRGAAGNLTVNAKESVELIGGLFLPRNNDVRPSRLSSESLRDTAGNAGNLTLETRRLIIRDGAQLTAETSGTGKGGNLTVNASESVELIGTSTLDDDKSSISAESGSTGRGGDITIETRQLIIKDGAEVDNTAENRGSAGNVTVRALESVELSGTSTNPKTDPPISRINASSRRTGAAGNLTVETGQLTLRDGARVSSESNSGNGGNISLQAQDFLLLRNQSQISTSAGIAQAPGNGGNITINSPFIVAVPGENSDITANAFSGSGGRVDITAQNIFGLTPRSRQELQALLGTDNPTELDPIRLPSNDITAISQTDPQLSGFVTFNVPDVDPTQGLVELPAELVDVSNQIATSCPADGENKFIITGRGGLPPNPNEPLTGEALLTDWATLDSDVENRSSTAPATNSTQESAPTQIVEANGWMINNKGEVVLVATAPTAIPDIPWIPSTECHAPEPSS